MSKNKYELWDIQKRIISFMTTEGWKTIPHASYIFEPEVTDFFAEFRKINKARDPELKFTFNTLMLKVISEALKVVPEMNAFLKYNHITAKGKLELREDINITMPTIIENGRMMAMNIPDCQDKNVDDITSHINDMVRRRKNTNMKQALTELSITDTVMAGIKGRPLQNIFKTVGSQISGDRLAFDKPKAVLKHWKTPLDERMSYKELRLGTMMVTNFGSTYRNLRGSASLVEMNPNSTSSISISSVQERAIAKNGKLEIGQVLPLTIVYDPRVVTIERVSLFCQTIDECFMNPKIIHSWLNTSVDTVKVEILEKTAVNCK